MKINNLRCEYRRNPLGIDITQPRLSWTLDSNRRGAAQIAYQVIAASEMGHLPRSDAVLWDSNKVLSDQSVQVVYRGAALQSRQRVYWRVRVWDEEDQPTDWSEFAWFEMGLLNQDDWKANWIGNPLVGGSHTPVPSPHFRKKFLIDAKISSARLYITSLGLYQVVLNGQMVGDDVFAPGWTNYKKRIQYQVYDVTDLLIKGQNVFGAVLGDGWYCGNIAWYGRQHYGDRPKMLGQLEITFADGAKQIIKTDKTWQTASGPLLEADLIMGEAYDARLELEGWDYSTRQPSNSSAWMPVLTFKHPQGMAIVAQNTPTVRAQGEIQPITKPLKVWDWPNHRWIYDFGQNLVGRVRLRVKGERGTTITLRFAEVLDENSTLYTKNLRSARQIDYYTLKGDPDGETWESSFTFHGFRYVELSGLAHKPLPGVLSAVVLHSNNSPTLKFECSNQLINQLQHNIEWGWKGNSLDIPTDCPQRDERLGWTGDGQVFVKTATYLMDVAGFFTKWVQDLADSQLENGAIPAVAPAVSTLSLTDGGPAWSDAFIIVPWTVWQQYGDTRIIDKHYQAMCTYLDYHVNNSPGLIRLLPDEKAFGESVEDLQIGGYGDWLAQDGNASRRGLTPKDLIGTAFLAYDARLLAQMAGAIGKPKDAVKYEQIFNDTRAAFIQHFITPDGLMVGQTQTSYILALYFDLVPEDLRSKIIDALIEDIEVTREIHMSTGFVRVRPISARCLRMPVELTWLIPCCFRKLSHPGFFQLSTALRPFGNVGIAGLRKTGSRMQV